MERAKIEWIHQLTRRAEEGPPPPAGQAERAVRAHIGAVQGDLCAADGKGGGARPQRTRG